MYIGQVAKASGCTPKAIRLYERIGLLPQVPRAGRYRVYDEFHLSMVRLIRMAQSVGFKLNELRPVMRSQEDGKLFPTELASRVLTMKQEAMESQIRQLRQQQLRIDEMKQTIHERFGETQSHAWAA